MLPVFILTGLVACASLACITALAGYYFCKVFPLNGESLSENGRYSTRIIRSDDMYQRLVMLQDELDALRDHNRHLRNITHMSSYAEADRKGVGGSPSYDTAEERTTDILTRKALAAEVESHIKALNESISNERKLSEDLMEEMERYHLAYAHTPMTWPTRGWVSSRYGWRNSPFTGDREFHSGLDVASRVDEPVYAPADGVVTAYYHTIGLGNVMVIDHGYGIVTRYGHLHEQVAQVGQEVGRGDRIALMGNTGRSTGPHLHYEVFVQGLSVNPQRYLLK